MWCRPEVSLGEDTMVNVKKLRVLQRKGDEMGRQKVVEKTRKYLASVGDRIKAVATQERTRKSLWQVSQNIMKFHCPVMHVRSKSKIQTEASLGAVRVEVHGEQDGRREAGACLPEDQSRQGERSSRAQHGHWQ